MGARASLARLGLGAETGEDAAQREGGKIRFVIADQRKKRIALAELG
jgi:hypothetical protein